MKAKWDAKKREALKSKRGAAKPEARSNTWQRPPEDEDQGPLLIWGIHAVAAALANADRRIVTLWATDNAALRLADGIAKRQVLPEKVNPRDLDQRLGPDTVHQGALLEVEPLPEHDMAKLAETILAKGPVLVLDQVTDPHNVGAILRSAAVFGSAGVVMTRRHSPPLGGVLAKAASGALELVPVALVQNLARTLSDLKAAGIVLVGLDGSAEPLLEDALLGGDLAGRPIALVLGAEGRGLRPLTAETCDRVCRIGSDGPIDSLNVSNAAAVALHLASMGRRKSWAQ